MTADNINGIIIFIILFLQLIAVAVTIAVDTNLSQKRRAIMGTLIASVALLVVQNYAEYVLVEYVFAPRWRVFVAAFGYSLRPAIIVFFLYMLSPDHKHWWTWILVGLNAILHFSAFFTDFVFTITESNSYVGGPLSSTCLIVSSILLVYHLFVAAREFRQEKRIGTLMPILFTILIVAGIILDIYKNFSIQHWVDYVTIAGVECCLCYYLWLHFIFARRFQDAILTEQRYNTMITQLQPHFIYNSLSAIAEIEGVPDKAQKAIVDFSDYLRKNLDAITSRELVTFRQEIEHIQKYVEVEKLRFGDKVNVVFDAQSDDFLLPALTVQMLVENAIKHGITKKYEGGTVWVTSKKEDKKHIVIVRDDGVGFDTEKQLIGIHIGLNNIRKRIEYSSGGTLNIVSKIGEGTTATITIPNTTKEIKQ